MSQSDLSSRLSEAIALTQNGQQAEAHASLIILSLEYPDVEQIWLWLAATANDPQERTQALYRVLRINPANEKARIALAQLVGQAAVDRIEIPEDDTLNSEPLGGLDTTKLARALGLAVVLLIAFVIIRLIVANTLVPLIVPKPTATATPRPTITRRPSFTPIPSMTFTPSITPGGPTLTPYVRSTLPPTWTLSPTWTPGPTFTKRPTFTPYPSRTPSETVTPDLSELTLPDTSIPPNNLSGSF